MAKTENQSVAQSIEQLITNVITDTVDRVKTNGIAGTQNETWKKEVINKYLVKLK